MIPELLFDLYLNAVYVKGIIDITLGRQGSWGPVKQPITDRPVVIQ